MIVFGMRMEKEDVTDVSTGQELEPDFLSILKNTSSSLDMMT